MPNAAAWTQPLRVSTACPLRQGNQNRVHHQGLNPEWGHHTVLQCPKHLLPAAIAEGELRFVRSLVGRMVFNRNKGFFLTLDDSAAPATLDLPQTRGKCDGGNTRREVWCNREFESPRPSSAAPEPSATEAIAEAKAESSSQPRTSLTTAEAIAAELAAAEAARPAVTYSTFAPGNLVPGGGLHQRNRRPGAALKSFRGIAQDLFKS